jgi:hypothetical protein
MNHRLGQVGADRIQHHAVVDVERQVHLLRIPYVHAQTAVELHGVQRRRAGALGIVDAALGDDVEEMQ